jgi:YebC/PmpR family DNA-binding regulatory protein
LGGRSEPTRHFLKIPVDDAGVRSQSSATQIALSVGSQSRALLPHHRSSQPGAWRFCPYLFTPSLHSFLTMAGHSKWSKVKHIKAVVDVRRGKLFSKLAKEISVAARLGGGDPSGNPRLKAAIAAARAQSMPGDNIDRAIKRGTGELAAAAVLEELIYEGYAPGGVAVLIEVATDNKNRVAQDLRLIFSKNHGHLASSGSVAYLFKRKGQITIPRGDLSDERALELALEAGGEDVSADAEQHIITTAHDQLYAVAEALKTAGANVTAQKLTYLPTTTVHLTDAGLAAQVLRLCDALEDNEDVQQIHANFDLPDDLLAQISGQTG